MKIRTIQISGFRKILKATINMEDDITVIAGANNSGKTSIVELFNYANLLTSGKMNAYLADIDRQAEELFLRLVKRMAEEEGITEALKASDQMKWVRQMNSIRNRATEIVNSELILI